MHLRHDVEFTSLPASTHNTQIKNRETVMLLPMRATLVLVFSATVLCAAGDEADSDDYYATLEVDKKATVKEIKKAYRRQAMKCVGTAQETERARARACVCVCEREGESARERQRDRERRPRRRARSRCKDSCQRWFSECSRLAPCWNILLPMVQVAPGSQPDRQGCCREALPENRRSVSLPR